VFSAHLTQVVTSLMQRGGVRPIALRRPVPRVPPLGVALLRSAAPAGRLAGVASSAGRMPCEEIPVCRVRLDRCPEGLRSSTVVGCLDADVACGCTGCRPEGRRWLPGKGGPLLDPLTCEQSSTRSLHPLPRGPRFGRPSAVGLQRRPATSPPANQVPRFVVEEPRIRTLQGDTGPLPDRIYHSRGSRVLQRKRPNSWNAHGLRSPLSALVFPGP
jgi:hypothetical protein